MPKASRQNGNYAPSEDQIRREQQCLELRRAGVDYQTIAERVEGVTNRGTAHRLVQSALKRTLAEPAADVRTLEADRLDRLQAAVWPAALRGDVKAIDRVLRISDQRCRLLGLNAPIKTELTVALDEGQARLMLGFIQNVLTDLNLTPEQQTVSGEIVSRRLRAIEGGRQLDHEETA